MSRKKEKSKKIKKQFLIVHFEDNFTPIKNMWVTSNFYLSKVVKIIKIVGSNWFLINNSASLHLMEIKPGYTESQLKTTLESMIKSKSRKIEIFGELS